MPLRFKKIKSASRINSQDILDLALSASSLVRELSSMSFFPPAMAAVSVVVLILETVQTNKESCLRLVRRCARILLDINDQMAGRWDTAPPTLTRNLERFQLTLTSIHSFLTMLTDASWGHRFLKKASIETALGDYSGQLEDAAQSFQITTLIDIHYAVASHKPLESPESMSDSKPPTKLVLPPPPYAATPSTASSSSTSQLVVSPTSLHAPSTLVSESATETSSSSAMVDDEIVSSSVLDSRGQFRRYHQSDVRLRSRSRLKDGWWAGASVGDVDGRPSLIKRYEGPTEVATRAWIRDVKLLQDVYHPNFPQLVGFSEDGAPTPFILLSNIQTRSPQARLLDVLKTDGLAACADLILHFYQDVVVTTPSFTSNRVSLMIRGTYRTPQPTSSASAISLIPKRRISWAFVALIILLLHAFPDLQFPSQQGASFRVDGSNTVIMGLPPPKDGWVTARNYGLTASLRMVIMGMLPNGGVIQYKRDDDVEEDGDNSRRISHLVTLTKGLLPADNAPITLSPRVKALLSSSSSDDDDEDDFQPTPTRPKLDLRQLRLSNIAASTHDHAWHENASVPSHKFSVGDLGFMPAGAKTFAEFITLGNVLAEGLTSNLDIEHHERGDQWCWNHFPVRRVEMAPYPLPGGATCWTVAVPPNAQIDCMVVHSTAVTRVANAWRFLLLQGKDLAAKHNVKPEDLMLITRAGTSQDFYIKDFRAPALPPVFHQQIGGHQPFGQGHTRPGFHSHVANRHPMHILPQQPTLPAVMYLMTSPSHRFDPYWSHSPVAVPPGAPRPDLQRGWTYKIGWSTGFINWIQLHPEDFAD
ncbi:hypothetical protein DXG03_004518 [Asterophora parasitica]|uniref:Mixed lineage kinase domain-containing protein n=1 Tax=Asterophora parasitica TaxID=117018 RepID=A0A9P7KA20_9AGAR|nr:hypothetical protein DXG03_004518 [Asterophora parasitica]